MSKEAAVLLSGGRDSLLSACVVLEQGYNVVPVICNNGHIEGIERAEFAVSSLKDRYGAYHVGDLEVCTTGMTFHSYMSPLWCKKPYELYSLYSNITMCQAHCLACKVAMYVHAIALCKARSIGYLVDGMRETQGFFVDLPEMRDRFRELCLDNGVDLLFPVYDLVSDLHRKRMLCDRGLPTKTLEPQCFLGCPMSQPLSSGERNSLCRFFDKGLVSLAKRDIQELVITKSC